MDESEGEFEREREGERERELGKELVLYELFGFPTQRTLLPCFQDFCNPKFLVEEKT